MKINIKGIIFIVIALIIAGIGFYVFKSDFKPYSLLLFAVAVVSLFMGVTAIFDNSSPRKAYDSSVKEIINTFDSVLVKSNSVPKLEGRNIINVESMDDMIDAQLEIRKPICYIKQTESCSFILLDEKEAYIYIKKLNEDVVSPIEIELNDIKLKQKNQEDMDSEMLKDIERTTIVKLSNKKSYKVSPIRKDKKKEEKQEEIKEEVKEDKKEEKKAFSSSDEIEIL